MSKPLSASDIRKAFMKPTLKTEIVKLQRLGIEVTVMEMDAGRLETYESLLVKVDDDGKAERALDNINAKIAVMSIVDDKGQLVFTPDDVEMLAHSYGKDVKAVANKAAVLSGLYAAEDVEKKSEPDRTSDT
ncbi:hypothetical protein [uncultured Endozoicomonas sp.]|uniref:hypothetical protein n=1 Tax=uncultured Endozoicomonas sp. TaxID=432652 RepID=UPI00260665FB|nr:hypothetical protein [uncultured Endozoicomonas sp.]